MVILGPTCGQVSVDFGAVAIGDFRPLRQSLDAAEQAKLNKWATRFMTVPLCEKHTTRIGNMPINLVVSKSGFGDGTYSVFRVEEKGRPAGVEIEFIKDGDVAPSAPDAEWVTFKRVGGKMRPRE